MNSKRGIAFRKWATKILKDYMLKGYAVNQKRLEYLEKTIKLIDYMFNGVPLLRVAPIYANIML